MTDPINTEERDRSAQETKLRVTESPRTQTSSDDETRLPRSETSSRLSDTDSSQPRRDSPRLEDAPVTAGQLLAGRYRLERELGAGGMGVVYFARDEKVKGEIFAIKVLKPEIRERPEALDLVREEVRKTRSIAGPNIVGMYSVDEDDCGNVFILMEYLEGKTLGALLDDDFGRGMPFSRAWPLIQDICAGLASAHDHNVIHSDLKPANIFITTGNRAKLLDFGIARAARGKAGRFDPGALGALTLAYASCEMLEGAVPDQRDDVYCLACVIYEMLTGKHPFDSPSALEARDDGLQIAPIASLTAGQNSALANALAFDRAKRTPSVEALLSGLESKTPPRPPTQSPGYVVWIGVGALMLMVLIGVVWYVVGEDKNKAHEPPIRSANPSNATMDKALNQVQALVARAQALEVDPNDESLRRGTQQLAAAQERLAAGAQEEGARLLGEAERALDSANLSGKRLAHLGSQPPEIDQARELCQQTPCEVNFRDESPRTVLLKPFELDQTEISNREFAEFVVANGYVTEVERAGGLYTEDLAIRRGQSWKTLRDSVGPTNASSEYPVRGIDFKSATDYCNSLGKRLPTEDEWEYVARGVDHRIFAWGNEPRAIEPGSPHSLLPVNEQPNDGALWHSRGLGDGVLEWVNGVITPGRVLRGASWLDTDPVIQRLATRRTVSDPRIHAFLDSGFRCARPVESWPDQVSEDRSKL
jgi:serine/threonine protein kinase